MHANKSRNKFECLPDVFDIPIRIIIIIVYNFIVVVAAEPKVLTQQLDESHVGVQCNCRTYW